MITSEAVRLLRRDAVNLPPDYLTRRDLYSLRSCYINSLLVLEHTIAEHEEAMQTPDVTIPHLAPTTSRALFALLFPVIGFAALAGFAAGVGVRVYQFTTNLF